MPKKLPHDTQKHTMLLFEGDFERLQEHYPEVGATAIIRKLVRAHLDAMDPPINTKLIKGTFNV